MSLFKELIYSISNFKAYGVFRQQSFGRTWLYLLFLSLIFGSIGFIQPWRTFNGDADDLSGWLNSQAPDFALAKGVFTISPETTAVYRKEGDFILVLGARADFNDSLLSNFSRGVLLYGDRIVVSGGEGQKRELPFKDYLDLKIDKKEILAALENRGLLSFFLAVFWMIFYIAGKMFSALFIAGLGMNFKAIMRLPLSFGVIYKLSIRALSLGIILAAILALSGMEFPYFFVVYYLIAVSYLWQGIKAIRDEDITAAGLKV